MPPIHKKKQQDLKDISVVRLKKSGQTFEVGCYSKHLTSWLTNPKSIDINEVLVTEHVFKSFSKGQLANVKDWREMLSVMDERSACLTILKLGKPQIHTEERNKICQETFQNIAKMLVEHCVDRIAKTPYDVSVIEKALEDIRFPINPEKGVKEQARNALEQLQRTKDLKILEANLRLMITVPAHHIEKLIAKIKDLSTAVENDFTDDEDMTVVVKPGRLRDIEDLVRSNTKGKGHVTVIDIAFSSKNYFF